MGSARFGDSPAPSAAEKAFAAEHAILAAAVAVAESTLAAAKLALAGHSIAGPKNNELPAATLTDDDVDGLLAELDV